MGCTFENGFSENIKKLVGRCNGNVGIGYKPKKTIRNLYPPKKDKIEKMNKAGLVYSVACKGCDKTYVGQTGRTLKHRMSQHKYDYNNKYAIAASNRNKTAAVQHSLDTGHAFDYDAPKILCNEQFLNKRLTKEMVLIKKSGKSVVNLKTDLDQFHKSLEMLCSEL